MCCHDYKLFPITGITTTVNVAVGNGLSKIAHLSGVHRITLGGESAGEPFLREVFCIDQTGMESA